MRKKTIIFLSVLVALLLGVIVAEVVYLYSGLDSVVAVESSEDEAEPAEEPSVIQEPVVETAPEPAPAAPLKQFTVKNFKTGKMNTLRQNADNSLTMLDETGAESWTIVFPGPVTDKVAEVDIFGNGKIQYMMTESDKLHCIDRLGREVEGFPIQLSAVATAGPDADGGVWVIKMKKQKAYFNRETMTVSNEKPTK